MQENINKTNEILEQKINTHAEKINEVVDEVHKKIVGQDDFIKSLLIWLFAKWHILVEWVPGLAKTLTIDTLSKTLDLGFNRIQFTPDLLPSDLIGAEIFNQKTGEFLIKKWPIFNNFILADEINRAPSKVQSALLEAMAEKQVTIWKESFPLENPFIVLATQNPIEQSGTYRLPEAQLDRFMLKVNVSYSSKQDEMEMYKKLNDKFYDIQINKILDKAGVIEIQKTLEEIYVSDNIFNYTADIIDATRNPKEYGLDIISKYLSYWISPRWGLSLIAWAKVLALMDKRSFVIPEDIKNIAKHSLTHRLVLNYEAMADSILPENIIDSILENVKVV